MKRAPPSRLLLVVAVATLIFVLVCVAGEEKQNLEGARNLRPYEMRRGKKKKHKRRRRRRRRRQLCRVHAGARVFRPRASTSR